MNFYERLSSCFQEKALPLREIISRLEKVYCGSIGAEFMHIPDIDQVLNYDLSKVELDRDSLRHCKN